MKKLLAIAVVLATALTVSAKTVEAAAPILVSGDASFVLEDALMYCQFDFSEAIEVTYETDGVTIEEVKGHAAFEEGSEFIDKALPKFVSIMPREFDKCAKKAGFPIRQTADRSAAKYEITFKVDTFDTGNGATKALLMAAFNKGNAIFTGDMIVKNIQTDEVVCVMHADKFWAPGAGALPEARVNICFLHGFIGQYLFDLSTMTWRPSGKGINKPYVYPEGK